MKLHKSRLFNEMAMLDSILEARPLSEESSKKADTLLELEEVLKMRRVHGDRKGPYGYRMVTKTL